MPEQNETKSTSENEKLSVSTVECNARNSSNETSEINKDHKPLDIVNKPSKQKSEIDWWLISALIYFALISYHSPLSLKLYLTYGSPTPCGALLNSAIQNAYQEAEKYKNDEWEYAGAILGTALGKSVAEQRINSLNFWECGSALSQIENKRDKLAR